ncbi:MAG: adenine nucleotide alpha hydrolase [Gammaproteobacteria bacterium]|nr:adenine nucleotide alpha hydrolase [Gammaproteobacteria bacterium]
MNVVLSWSSGKDSAWTLQRLQAAPGIHLAGLCTTINEQANRVAMHAVRRELLDRQAAAAGLALDVIPLPFPCSNTRYEDAMRAYFADLNDRGVDAVAYGDLHLADVREYRENLMRDSGLQPLFPIWGSDTRLLGQEMAEAGLRARITCVDPAQLGREFCGREFDSAFLADLPDGIDHCGENGEFHSYTYAGPMFSAAINVTSGDTVERDGFVSTDLVAE